MFNFFFTDDPRAQAYKIPARDVVRSTLVIIINNNIIIISIVLDRFLGTARHGRRRHSIATRTEMHIPAVRTVDGTILKIITVFYFILFF